MRRREFLQGGAYFAGVCATRLLAGEAPFRGPVLDAHIHLFDTARAGGVPWPEPNDSIFRPALPDRYQRVAKDLGVVGAIAIEASPLIADNDWLLGVAEKNPFIVGVVGDLVPGSSNYELDLERFRANPLFLGLRYGNLWGRNLALDVRKPGFFDGLQRLSQRGLVFESANPNPELIRTLADLAERLPELTIVIDHLPHAVLPEAPSEKIAYSHQLDVLASAPRVFIKLSEIPYSRDGSVSASSSSYKATLDELWDRFGDDKVLFGSDWPNSDHLLQYGDTIGLLQSYAAGKDALARKKLFWRNSISAYRWRRRLLAQPVA